MSDTTIIIEQVEHLHNSITALQVLVVILMIIMFAKN